MIVQIKIYIDVGTNPAEYSYGMGDNKTMVRSPTVNLNVIYNHAVNIICNRITNPITISINSK